MSGAEYRANLLNEARGYVTKDRNTSYGEPENNFADIAAIWNAQLSHKLDVALDATDVALLMVGMKLARLKHNPTHRDSWVDGAGYIACGAQVASDAQLLAEQERAEASMPLITDGPFKGWREAGFVDETENGRLADDLADVAAWRITDGNSLFHRSPVAPVTVNVNDVGWVSDNRCGEADANLMRIGPNPHEPHSYGHDQSYWCDGWVPEHRAQQARDIAAVKRVADKHALRDAVLEQMRTGVDMRASDELRVLKEEQSKDNPQA